MRRAPSVFQWLIGFALAACGLVLSVEAGHRLADGKITLFGAVPELVGALLPIVIGAYLICREELRGYYFRKGDLDT